MRDHAPPVNSTEFLGFFFLVLVHGPDQISVPNRGTKRECYQLIVLPEVF